MVITSFPGCQNRWDLKETGRFSSVRHDTVEVVVVMHDNVCHLFFHCRRSRWQKYDLSCFISLSV